MDCETELYHWKKRFALPALNLNVCKLMATFGQDQGMTLSMVLVIRGIWVVLVETVQPL